MTQRQQYAATAMAATCIIVAVPYVVIQMYFAAKMRYAVKVLHIVDEAIGGRIKSDGCESPDRAPRPTPGGE